MGEKINVKKIVEEEKQKLKQDIKNLKEETGVVPKLAVILASEDKASRIYVGKKRKMCEELGVLQEEYILDEKAITEDVLDRIHELNDDEKVHGILVQLPLYKHLDTDTILNAIDPRKDVDGFHPLTLGKLLIGEDSFVSCTPKGIMTILDKTNTKIEGKHAVVVGRSRIVGKPIAEILVNRNATVTICHSKTENLAYYTKQADILIVAVGKPHIITKDMVKEGATVIDVGINRIDGKIIGDVDTENVLDVCGKITPVPGGVGLTTVLSLLQNVYESAKNKTEY